MAGPTALLPGTEGLRLRCRLDDAVPSVGVSAKAGKGLGSKCCGGRRRKSREQVRCGPDGRTTTGLPLQAKSRFAGDPDWRWLYAANASLKTGPWVFRELHVLACSSTLSLLIADSIWAHSLSGGSTLGKSWRAASAMVSRSANRARQRSQLFTWSCSAALAPEAMSSGIWAWNSAQLILPGSSVMAAPPVGDWCAELRAV